MEPHYRKLADIAEFRPGWVERQEQAIQSHLGETTDPTDDHSVPAFNVNSWN